MGFSSSAMRFRKTLFTIIINIQNTFTTLYISKYMSMYRPISDKTHTHTILSCIQTLYQIIHKNHNNSSVKKLALAHAISLSLYFAWEHTHTFLLTRQGKIWTNEQSDLNVTQCSLSRCPHPTRDFRNANISVTLNKVLFRSQLFCSCTVSFVCFFSLQFWKISFQLYHLQ